MTNKAPKILIIDDDFSFAKFARMILEAKGYAVVVLLEGERAVEVAQTENPNLILLDMSLQGITGTQIIRMLKGDPATMNTPILLCSITRSRKEVQEALNCGALEYLTKPLKSDILMEHIHKALGTQAA